MSAPRPRTEVELANVVDAIAALWPDHSQREIARKLDLKPGVVSGLIMRARKNSDARFPHRPDPAPKVKPPPKVRKFKPAAVAIGNAPPPQKPRLLVDLGWQDCRWPVGTRGTAGTCLRSAPSAEASVLRAAR